MRCTSIKLLFQRMSDSPIRGGISAHSKLETGNSKLLLQLFNRDVIVGKDADLAGNFHGLFSDLARRQSCVLGERRRGGGRIRASATDGGDAGVRLNHVALSADEKSLGLVGDQEQSLKLAEHLVGAPVLGQLNRGAANVAVILLQLRFEARKERKRVGRGAGKPGQDLVLVEPPDLAGGVLDDAFPERDLAVSSHYHLVIPANAKNGSRANQTLLRHE